MLTPELVAAQLLLAEDYITVPVPLANLLGLSEAVLVKAIDKWCHSNRENRKEIYHKHDFWWTSGSYKEWLEKMPFLGSESSIKRLMLNLEKSGVIVSGCFNRKTSDRSKWYRVDHAVLGEMYLRRQVSVESHRTKMDDDRTNSDDDGTKMDGHEVKIERSSIYNDLTNDLQNDLPFQYPSTDSTNPLTELHPTITSTVTSVPPSVPVATAPSTTPTQKSACEDRATEEDTHTSVATLEKPQEKRTPRGNRGKKGRDAKDSAPRRKKVVHPWTVDDEVEYGFYEYLGDEYDRIKKLSKSESFYPRNAWVHHTLNGDKALGYWKDYQEMLASRKVVFPSENTACVVGAEKAESEQEIISCPQPFYIWRQREARRHRKQEDLLSEYGEFVKLWRESNPDIPCLPSEDTMWL